MRVVAVSRVLDEVDIIEAFIRHAATFVDHHVVLDNGSRDGTVEILEQLHREGCNLTVYRSPSLCFSERNLNTWLYRTAIEDHDADWVACLDADEFYDERHLPGGLRRRLKELEHSRDRVVAVKVPWTQYHYTRSDRNEDHLVPRRITHRRQPVNDYKVIASWRLGAIGGSVAEGQHDVQFAPDAAATVVTEPRLWLAHFSERNAFQHIMKFTRGWAKVLMAGRPAIEHGFSNHYRGPFEILRDRPQDLLRSEHFMAFKNDGLDLVHDPIPYRGGDLRYTPPNDPQMQTAQALMGFLNDIAERHGRMLDAVPEAKAFSDAEESRIERMF